MSFFLLNLVLAMGWLALTGQFSLLSLVGGYVIGFGALWVFKPMYAQTRYFSLTKRVVGLILFFLQDLVMSSLRVVYDIVTPPIYARPGIIAMPLDAKTDVEILVTTNLISLTPGTLSLDLSPDRKILYVHAMFVDDPEALKRELKAGMEAKVLEALR